MGCKRKAARLFAQPHLPCRRAAGDKLPQRGRCACVRKNVVREGRCFFFFLPVRVNGHRGPQRDKGRSLSPLAWASPSTPSVHPSIAPRRGRGEPSPPGRRASVHGDSAGQAHWIIAAWWDPNPARPFCCWLFLSPLFIFVIFYFLPSDRRTSVASPGGACGWKGHRGARGPATPATRPRPQGWALAGRRRGWGVFIERVAMDRRPASMAFCGGV